MKPVFNPLKTNKTRISIEDILTYGANSSNSEKQNCLHKNNCKICPLNDQNKHCALDSDKVFPEIIADGQKQCKINKPYQKIDFQEIISRIKEIREDPKIKTKEDCIKFFISKFPQLRVYDKSLKRCHPDEIHETKLALKIPKSSPIKDCISSLDSENLKIHKNSLAFSIHKKPGMIIHRKERKKKE